jgi:hypothetical protein
MRVFFPPFVAFVVFGLIVVLHSFIYPMHLSDMGKGNLHAFMACFYYMWPLYFITALLTQWVLTLSIWDSVKHWRIMGKDAIVTLSCVVCGSFAGGIAYIIWDEQTGRLHLAWLAVIMLMVQLAYWIMNIFVLILFDEGKIKLPHKLDKTAE